MNNRQDTLQLILTFAVQKLTVPVQAKREMFDIGEVACLKKDTMSGEFEQKPGISPFWYQIRSQVAEFLNDCF